MPQPNQISLELGADHLRDPSREDGMCLWHLGVTGRSIEILPGRPGPSTPREGRGVPAEKRVNSDQIFPSEPGTRHAWDPRCENGTSLRSFSATWHPFKENFPQTSRGLCVTERQGRAIPSLCPGIPTTVTVRFLYSDQ